jgi:hypothetical protein
MEFLRRMVLQVFLAVLSLVAVREVVMGDVLEVAMPDKLVDVEIVQLKLAGLVAAESK